MNLSKARQFRWVRKREPYLLVLLSMITGYYAYVIITYPFPDCLPFLLSLPVLAIIFYDIHWGIFLWYSLSLLGSGLAIDLPGFPPLYLAHIILLLLLSVWFIKSYQEFFSSIVWFLSTTKNRILLILLGWITLSMVIARLEGVTQRSIEYQFNAWLSIILVVSAALFLSYQFNERFLKRMIWIMVCLQTVLYVATLGGGLLQGVGLFEWQEYIQEFNDNYGFVMVSPLFLALLFFRQQKFWGKVLFSIAIIVSLAYSTLLIIAGHRTTILWLVSTLGFILLFIRPRLLIVVLFLAVLLPFILLDVPTIQSWINEQSGYSITSENVVYGQGSRIALAKDAVQIIKRHPIWGTGTDFYWLHSNLRLVYAGGKKGYIPSAHNSWLQVAVDHGLPAAVLLIIFCGYVLKDCIFLFRSLDNQFFKMFALFFLSTFGANTIGSFISSGHILPVFTGTYGDIKGVLFSFWFLYGLLLGIENKQVERNFVVGTSHAEQ